MAHTATTAGDAATTRSSSKHSHSRCTRAGSHIREASGLSGPRKLDIDSSVIVHHQVRYEANVKRSTRVKFMTDGILLKEIQQVVDSRASPALLNDCCWCGRTFSSPSTAPSSSTRHTSAASTQMCHPCGTWCVLRCQWVSQVLIGLLSRVVDLRKQHYDDALPGSPSPLKLIIMSATLRTADFTDNRNLFPIPPPVVSVPGRTHEVL